MFEVREGQANGRSTACNGVSNVNSEVEREERLMDVALELEALVVELSLCLERRGLNDCSRTGVLEARLAVGARGRAPERLGVWLRVPVWQRVWGRQ